ncbi:cytochrome P450 6B1 [Halyomorpha halys]|uniref:cytochrome P450 6B1 n=1 Tax=Halyomorpha halys TaxID=286706 RepID=UPI0006D4EE82|nr:cytochrome P450 6B1-like [Halyomorpha halys]
MLTMVLLVAAAIGWTLYFGLVLWKANIYWKVRGVNHFKPWPFVGNLARAFLFNRHISFFYDEIYKAFPKDRMVGMYEFLTPTLILRDPALVENVLVKEFSTYPDHGPLFFEPNSISYESVFTISGSRWRGLRNKLLTSFSTGKMKVIFPEMVQCCQRLVDSDPRKLHKDLLHDFAVKSFMSSMFGTKILPEGEEELIAKTKEVFQGKPERIVQQIMLTFFPKLADFLNLKFMPKSLDIYFRDLLNTLIEQRELSNSKREDYAQVLCDLKKMGKMNVYNRENNRVDETFEVTNDMVLAQAFMFFFAGLDSTVLLMLHTAFELSLAKDCQEKARQEVRSVLKKYGGYSWEAVREMKYLDQCIQETLRIHPSLQFIIRMSDRDTEIGGVKIKKDTRIIIPLHSIQMDPTHFPNPDLFDPERFNEPLSSKFIHLPFSEGPRVCLGKRFAIMETATIMAHILDNFELHPSPETKLPFKYEPNAIFHTPISNDEISVILKRIM